MKDEFKIKLVITLQVTNNTFIVKYKRKFPFISIYLKYQNNMVVLKVYNAAFCEKLSSFNTYEVYNSITCGQFRVLILKTL